MAENTAQTWKKSGMVSFKNTCKRAGNVTQSLI